ncbi:Uncharacterised protein [Acinetobacter baumannii]|nr:Uncharacterised protein [Acinetobacter baumannii]
MRFVKTIACELFHIVEDMVSCAFINTFLSSTLKEDLALFHHFFRFLFTHRTAEQVSATECVTCTNLCSLHYLFLVNHNPVGWF